MCFTLHIILYALFQHLVFSSSTNLATKHLTHQSGMKLVFLQHFLSELLTERGKILDDWGSGARPFWVSCFLVTRNKFLNIVADVGVGRHLV